MPKAGTGSQIIRVKQFEIDITVREANYQQKHQIREREHNYVLPLNFFFFVGKPRYAETWDFHVSASTFLQFEMSMGCSKPFSDSHNVQLQYSLNNGRDWHLVTEECVPPTIGCLHYTESSIYTSERFQNWKRITVYLPLSTM